MAGADQADWRDAVKAMRTIRALRGDASAAEASAALAGLSNVELSAAAENPEHSEAGRAAARARASSRWRLSVPGFIREKDLARGQRLFFGFGRAVRKWSGIAFYLVLCALVAAAFWVQHEVEHLTRDVIEQMIACEYHGQCDGAPIVGEATVLGSPDRSVPVDRRPLRERMSEAQFRAQMERVAGRGWVDNDTIDAIAAPVALVFSVPLVIWFLATAFRRKPARVVLLRKFNVRALSVPLERMMAHELRPFGHVVSLSDKHIRRDTFGWLSTAILSLSNPLAAAWFVIGAPIRFVVRLFDRSAMGPAVVLDARDYRNLAKRLRDRVGLNLQMAFTSKEAVLVRTSDTWWRMVARLLMDSADVVVMDLSDTGAGSEWELDRLKADGADARCVFVSLWGKAETAEQALRARGFANRLFAYAPDGEMQQRAAFRAAMLEAMKAARP
ncbi:MAG TPA: hypothetical protein VG841_00235 [Caulobacterales bacterium]|nr:hypothetical protein [Caulobacterales bacterium]